MSTCGHYFATLSIICHLAYSRRVLCKLELAGQIVRTSHAWYGLRQSTLFTAGLSHKFWKTEVCRQKSAARNRCGESETIHPHLPSIETRHDKVVTVGDVLNGKRKTIRRLDHQIFQRSWNFDCRRCKKGGKLQFQDTLDLVDGYWPNHPCARLLAHSRAGRGHHEPLLYDIMRWTRFDGIKRVYRTPHGIVMVRLRNFAWETPPGQYFAREPRCGLKWYEEEVVRDAVELSRKALEVIELSSNVLSSIYGTPRCEKQQSKAMATIKPWTV